MNNEYLNVLPITCWNVRSSLKADNGKSGHTLITIKKPPVGGFNYLRDLPASELIFTE